MVVTYYSILLALSMVLAAVYAFMWHKHFDTSFTVIFLLVPIVCLGYVMLATAESLGAAVSALKIVYIGGSFLPYFIMVNVLNLCRIHVPRRVRRLIFLLSMLLYCAVLTIGRRPYFYKEISFEIIEGAGVLHRTYGVLHQFYFTVISLYFALSLFAIAYAYFRKKPVSRRTVILLIIPDAAAMLTYFIGKRITDRFDLIPAAYVFGEIMFLLIVSRVNLYDLNDTVIDSMVQNGGTGFISFDLNQRYISSNSTAKKLLPGLNEFAVDAPIPAGNADGQTISGWLKRFAENESMHEFVYTVRSAEDPDDEEGRMYYDVQVSRLYDEKKHRGFLITLTDDTQNRKYIRLLDRYSEELQDKVAEKTQHIVEMHDNLIMSLATMVESRDNSTGGHIRRTSEGVRILIGEMRQDPETALSEEFCRNLIKAAPMHDLGKIAVDDAILRKPGRFTDAEFAEMKKHAAEGARVIHEILEKTDDDAFHILAENVAHYHHERWDGSGYPDNLKGEQIPLEARIMAIADVYDALVSKRVYKDSMSFADADAIIMRGMGTQFDPSLEKYYVSARPKLEAYYSSLLPVERAVPAGGAGAGS